MLQNGNLMTTLITETTETPSTPADEAMRAIVIAARDAWLANWTTTTLQRLEAALSKSLSEAWPDTPSAAP